MQLTVTTNPPKTLRLNPQVICRILGVWLQAEVYNDAFLRRCGVQVNAVSGGLEIGFIPNTGLRINERAVSHILERRLLDRVSQDSFLDKCNIQLAVKEAE